VTTQLVLHQLPPVLVLAPVPLAREQVSAQVQEQVPAQQQAREPVQVRELQQLAQVRLVPQQVRGLVRQQNRQLQQSRCQQQQCHLQAHEFQAKCQQ
jgi:hypothetical protein